MKKPDTLSGVRALITRPQPQGLLLSEALQSMDATTYLFPTLEIVSQLDIETIETAKKVIKQTDILIFVSQHAAQPLLSHCKDILAPILSVGASTTKSIESAGFSVANTPQQDFSTQGLLSLPELSNIDKKHILIIAGEGGNQLLQKTLKSRGAYVKKLAVYRRVCPTYSTDSIKKALAFQPNIIISTSKESLMNLYRIFNAQIPLKTHLLVISHEMCELAKQLKIGQSMLIAENPTTPAIINALLTQWRPHG